MPTIPKVGAVPRCECCGRPFTDCLEYDYEDYEDHPDTIFGAEPGMR